MEIVYIRGGDKHAPEVAKAAGMHYGTRHDYKSYGDVWMLDIKWTKYDWRNYLDIVRQHAPMMALAPDYEWPWQWTALQRQIDDLRGLVAHVLVCPKFVGAVCHIPLDCVVAVSVPAPSYAGFLPDLRDLAGRKVHLLGGRPETQARLIQRLHGVGAEVFSVDGSYLSMKAGHGQWFDGSRWIQLNDKRTPNWELETASAVNVVKLLRAQTEAQPMLGL
jgi:hypothetical protein